MHIVRLMKQPSKRYKKNDDKSAVAMLKKNDWHEIVQHPVVNLDQSHERSGRPDKNRGNHHELKRGPTGRRSSNARQLGCVFQDMKPPKSILRKSSDMQKPIHNRTNNLHRALFSIVVCEEAYAIRGFLSSIREVSAPSLSGIPTVKKLCVPD